MASLAEPAVQPRAQSRTPVALAVGLTALGAGLALGFTIDSDRAALSHHLGRTLAFLAATLLLQLFGIRLPGRGSVGVSAVGLIGAAIALGTGPAMTIGVVAALAQWIRSRGLAHRALFDAANFALAAGASGLVFHAVDTDGSSGTVRLLAALCAGLVYTLVNHALLTAAMAVSEHRAPAAVWLERFHWARYHFLAFGALGLLAATADAQLGAAAAVVFVLPPILLARTMRPRAETSPI